MDDKATLSLTWREWILFMVYQRPTMTLQNLTTLDLNNLLCRRAHMNGMLMKLHLVKSVVACLYTTIGCYFVRHPFFINSKDNCHVSYPHW